MLERLRKKKNKMGVQSLLLIVGVLIGFISIGGLADLTILQTKFSTLSQQTGYVSRAVSSQSGVRMTELDDFHGRYVTTQELYKNVNQAMNHAGIEESEWDVYVGGYLLTPSTETPIYEYRQKIPVSVTIRYGWPFSSQFLPTSSTGGSRTSETEVVNTYHHRTGGYSE